MRLGLFAIAASLSSAAVAEMLLVGNKQEHTVSFVDLKSGKEVARLPTGRAPHEIAVSPDGRTAAVVSYREPGFSGNTLHLFEVAAARGAGEIALAGHQGLHGVKWLAQGDRLFVTSEVTDNIAEVDMAAKRLRASFPTGAKGSHLLAVSPDARRVYVSNIASGSVTVIDPSGKTANVILPVGAGAEAIAVSPDGKRLLVGANEARKLVEFDTATLRKLGETVTEGVPIRVEYSPDGRVVAVSEPDRNRVVILDSASRARRAVVDLAASDLKVPVTLLFAPDGKRLWVSATGSSAVAEIDTATWTVTRSFAVGKGADGLGYSPVAAKPQSD